MEEFKFVLKGLAIACVLTIILQARVGGETLEIKADRMLHHSAIGGFLGQTAEGAARLLHTGSQEITRLLSSTLGKSDQSRK